MGKKEINYIKKVISILDSVDYAHYSDGKANTYLEYAKGSWKDERKLIDPIIFPKFLEQVLGFKLGENIASKETIPEGKDIPDYIPVDTRTHPFVFDCKGMDADDLSVWYPQIKRYLEGQGLKYGILSNMRDLDVYTLVSEDEIEAFNFNFVELYNDYKENMLNVLEKENTKRFLKFIEYFRYKELIIDEKLKRIAEAKPWTGEETLNIYLLTKRLHYIVECIYGDATARKKELILLKEADPGRAIEIAKEIESIASEIERGREAREASIEIFEEILSAPSKSVLGRAIDLFFYRVGYFTMTRLLLARAWEDIGFIDQTLYDGGLAKWYENFNKEIHRVLRYSFGLAAERYKWLFNIDNNYTWYEPSDDTLIEALYELSNFNLGKLDQDVLGTIYEEYIDKVDKKQKGQYYTPREIIEFIWNRVGFANPQAFFWHSEGKREPKLIFDPVTGSGGFLVEAARRIRDESGINRDDFQNLLDIRTAILAGIFGSEISIFPYYITEVNLLIQLTSVVKRMMELKKRLKESLPLAIVPVDALYLYNPGQIRLEKEEYEFNQIRDLLPLGGQKKAIFQKIKEEYDGKFSYCCANPPYIGEKGNKDLFISTLQRFPYWKEFYQGKMNYLYFFIILGISKLHNPGELTPSGKLGFITTAYWPIADGASKLRKYILENAKIKEMVFFEDVKIFEYAKGQHNMVFILEKCAGNERVRERDENRIKIVRVLAKHQEIPGNSIREKLKFLTQHIQQNIDENEWQDEYIRVFLSGVKQGDLPKDGEPWVFGESILDPIIEKIVIAGEPLGNICNINQGVVSGAPKVTKKNIGKLSDKIVSNYGIKEGDGIFVLSRDELSNLNIEEKERALLKPYYRCSDIYRYCYEKNSFEWLIYITKSCKPSEFANLMEHLQKFKAILEEKRETKQGRLPWYCLYWPRDSIIFETNKIVTPNFAPVNTFVQIVEPFYAEFDVYFITKKKNKMIPESFFYFEGLLNSNLLDYWYSKHSKRKGERGETRVYNTTLLSQVPIRRINFDNPQESKMHDKIVEKVKAIRNKMVDIAYYSKYFIGPRLTQLMPKDSLSDINPEIIVQDLSPEKRYSLRTHPEIIYTHDFNESKFLLTKIGKVEFTLEGPELKLIGKDRKAIFLKGPAGLLRIISLIFANHKNESWAAIKEMPFIPETAKDYENKKQEIIKKVINLRAEIQKLQTSIDKIVLKLYAVSESLQKEIT